MGRIGTSGRNSWIVEDGHIDLCRGRPGARAARFATMDESVTVDLASSALVVVDMQKDFCAPEGMAGTGGRAVDSTRPLVERIQQLVPVLRASGVPIIWVNWGNRPDRANLPPGVIRIFDREGTGAGIGAPNPVTGHHQLEAGSPSADLADGLEAVDGDIRIDKYRIDGFVDTELDSVLRVHGVTTVFFAGVNLDQCVMFTLGHAAQLGYDVVLLDDCSGTTSPGFCSEATLYNVRRCLGFVTSSTDLMAGLG